MQALAFVERMGRTLCGSGAACFWPSSERRDRPPWFTAIRLAAKERVSSAGARLAWPSLVTEVRNR